MTTIYDEFRHLADGDPATLNLIHSLEFGELPADRQKKVAHAVWKAICPTAPPGQRHARDSFWGQANSKCIYWGLFGHRPEQKAAWMREQRVRGAKLVPHFEPMARLPQPSARRF